MPSTRIKISYTPKTPSSLGKSPASRLSTAPKPSSSPPRVSPPKAGNPTPSVGGKFGNIKISSQSGIHVKGNQNRIEVSGSGHVFGNATINNPNGPAATPSASATSPATGSKASTSASNPTGSSKPPASASNPRPTGSQPGSKDKQVWPQPSQAAIGATSGAKTSTSAAPPGVNLTKEGNSPPSIGGKFGNIQISNQSGIHVKGNQNQIQVSGSGHVFGNVTINNHNGPAAAPEGGNKNKFKFGDFIKEVTKGAKDISDAGLRVLEKSYDGAVKTASK